MTALLIVSSIWGFAFLLVLVFALVMWLAEHAVGGRIVRAIDHALSAPDPWDVTPVEAEAEARLIPAVAVHQVIAEAERACWLVGWLEAEWALPCAPNPRPRERGL